MLNIPNILARILILILLDYKMNHKGIRSQQTENILFFSNTSYDIYLYSYEGINIRFLWWDCTLFELNGTYTNTIMLLRRWKDINHVWNINDLKG